MAREDPALRGYRRVLVALLLVAGLLAVGAGAWLLWRGRVFPALMALLVLALLMLLVHGYRQDEEERGR